jgi:uncharacterized 2Fe-2S/4Fe-4S cluster protein (DUF4445 family)
MSETVRIELIPLGIQVEAPRGAAFADFLAAYGVEFPCGGSDQCGGCRIRVVEGSLPAHIEDKLVFSEEELAQGWRLACRGHAWSSVKLEIGQWSTPVLADDARLEGGSRTGLGIAIDVGTTTIAAQLLDLASGEVLAVHTALNPQCAHGADVMSRVSFALRNPGLTPLIRSAIGIMVDNLAGSRPHEIREIVLVGNTVMHHLFAGLDIEPLSHAPFAPRDAGEQYFAPEQLGWCLPSSCRVRFLRCLGGFVGSDILAGIIATGIGAGRPLRVLIDLGTNGEIVLGDQERMLCASTAAGPAFEAASIRKGMRAAEGAISQVFLRDHGLECHVIGGSAPRGICGSGLVDAVAAGLDLDAILPSGRLARDAKDFSVAGPVSLAQSDIRELQLAKAAVASGLRLLLTLWGATHEDIDTVYLAGAFGNYVRRESAVRIGLLETPPCRIAAAGNTALRGAKMVLLSSRIPPLVPIEHVPLASEPDFQETFIQCLNFPSFPPLTVAHR